MSSNIQTTRIGKSFFTSTENLTRLAVLLVGLVAAVFGLPEDLATGLEDSLIQAITSVAGLIAVLAMVWSFVTEGGAVRSAAFFSGITDRIGWQTPEFWISIAGTVVGLLVLLGVVSSDQGDTVSQLVATIIEAIFALLTAVGSQLVYARSRRNVKVAIAESAR